MDTTNINFRGKEVSNSYLKVSKVDVTIKSFGCEYQNVGPQREKAYARTILLHF